MASHVSTRYRIILREENLQSLATYKIVQMKENENEIVVPCRCCLMNTSNSNEENGRICSIHLIRNLNLSMFAKAMNELDLDLEVFTFQILNLQYYPVKLKHAKSLFLHYRYPAINKPAGVVHWTSRRDILLEYVKNVQPEFMELFVKRAPQQVAENLAQLMYSVLMTGYMFRNAQYRLELQQSLEQVALPDTSSQEQKIRKYDSLHGIRA
ncbi:hypothetical protein L2E82_36394 [Cichorium intybus]|uniref:Uncharacterized protein n=1 Tax=Cichorium intybus TaxID=13427 RepID=A0ACB9BRF1_CICIN|nr:hypothetical protein L2E82_36394 [Cichorium intybus]